METNEVDLGIGPDMVEISSKLSRFVDQTGIRDGALSATVIGSTGSLTTIEYEPGVMSDLKRAIKRMAPIDDHYAHEAAWHDGNGHSHVQAAIMGPSIHLPVRHGRLHTGTWQQVIVINHDNRARQRKIEITLVGRLD
jgi:secondary thiamine-phosphate synthase enzyme